MKQYTINIIEETTSLAGVVDNEKRLVINIDQLSILERFSNQKIDRRARKIFTINGCDFTITPCLDVSDATAISGFVSEIREALKGKQSKWKET